RGRRTRSPRSPPEPRSGPGPRAQSAVWAPAGPVRGPAPARRLVAPGGVRPRAARSAVAGPRAGGERTPSAASEAAPARGVLAQRALEHLAGEVRPELVAEHQLRVGALPQQVVGDPLLAAGADDQVRVVHVRRVEVLTELCLGGS